MAKQSVAKQVSTQKPVKSAQKTKQPTAKTTDLPIAAVVRIAKANGAERVGSDGAATLVMMAEDYIGKLANEANKLAAHAGRKTIKEEDVEMAAQNL